MVQWEVDTSVNHFNNIITDFGINCEGKVGIGLIGSMYYVGEATASVCYLLSVKCMSQSRYPHIIFRNMAMMLVMFLLILEIRSLILLYWAVFLIGFCQAISIIQGFPYLMESLPMSKRNITATFTGMIDKVLLVISTLLLKYYVSNWVIIMLPALFTSLIAATLTFFLIDSP